MLKSIIYIITLLFQIKLTLSAPLQNQIISKETYNQLFEFASLNDISYCSSLDLLTTGSLTQACPLPFCTESNGVEILQIFSPPGNDIGSTGYLAINHVSKQIYVVFRGSSTVSDWLADLMITPIRYESYANKLGLLNWQCDDCLVHKGFYESFGYFIEVLFPQVIDLLESTGYQLVVTGHSLGGAWALLACVEFQILGYDPLLVTFGQPRIAATDPLADLINGLFHTSLSLPVSGALHKGYYRMVHRGDIVPEVPPGFVHAGVEIFIDQDGLPQYRENISVVSSDSRGRSVISNSEYVNATQINIPNTELTDLLFAVHRSYLVYLIGCA